MRPEDGRVETTTSFQIPVMGARFDFLKSPIQWLDCPKLENPAHLLLYPFVFNLKGQIACFRSMNYVRMFRKYEESILASRLLAQMSYPDALTGRGEIRVQEKFEHLMKSYFVIEIRRDNVLLDAINQLYRREKRDLMKPLKVRMGMDEGEEGVDHGGVQQEFFRIAIAAVMNPEYGVYFLTNACELLTS